MRGKVRASDAHGGRRFPKSMANESVGRLQPVMQTLPTPPPLPLPPLLLLQHNIFSKPSGLQSGQLQTKQDQEPWQKNSGGHKYRAEKKQGVRAVHHHRLPQCDSQ